MKEILRIRLDNEMDLILAHKRTMKLAELCGLFSSAQTRFATAVSEIARCSIANGLESSLTLGIRTIPGGKKEISAIINDRIDLAKCNPEAFAYAERLSKGIVTDLENDVYSIMLNAKVPYSGILSEGRAESFIDFFKREAPLSPYDEIRRKNIQLIELADKLSESEGSYRQLTDTLPLIVFSVSKADKISLVNKSAENILGPNYRDFSPSVIAAIIYKNDIEGVARAWSAAKKKHSLQLLQGRVVMDGKAIWHQISFVPNADDKNDITGWIVTMVNIHAQKLVEETLKDNRELKEAQEKLKLYNDELQKKNKELEQFAYVASHDLQEPLRKIRNFISLAQRSRSDSEKQDLYYSKINSSAERMSHLITDVLGYSKLSVTSDEFAMVDLNSVIADVIGDFEFLINEKNAEISVGDMPQLSGSPVQLSQLFYNLVSNSLKFADAAPRINIYNEVVAANGGQLNKITVSDNGIGISSQYIEKIFTMFKRLHSQNEYPGTGIGLAICKKIAENHSGRIEMESTPGVGTTVHIYLPV